MRWSESSPAASSLAHRWPITNVLEIHTDGLRSGQRILIVDDLLATGGTTEGTVRLVESLGARVVSLAFLIELSALQGRSRLPGHDVFALLSY
jgi:adenine phosphoribosyltransferase